MPLLEKASILFVTAALSVACAAHDATGGSPGGGGGSGDPTGDPDADYLSNADERTAGTNPNLPDTDADGYLDGDEVLVGANPLDPSSRIYQGGWPFQRNKDSIVDPGFSATPSKGAVVPRLVAFDQYGQKVDLYDFALHGRPIVIDLSAFWCGACQDMAGWLEGKPSMLDAKPQFASIRDRVNSGDIYWITVIFEDGAGVAAGPAQAVKWAAEFPNDKVTVLADDNRALFDSLYPGSYPSLQVLNEDMTFRYYDRFDYEKALTTLLP